MIIRRDADGNPTSFQTRYVNPLDPSKKVSRNFRLGYGTEAYKWLVDEVYMQWARSWTRTRESYSSTRTATKRPRARSSSLRCYPAPSE